MPTRRCFKCMNELSGTTPICPKCGFDNTHPAQSSPAALPCGTVLHERYMIGRMLGQGGFGITYIGFDYTLETPVCIKEFFPVGGAMRSPGSTHVYWGTDTTGAAMKQGRETFVKEARKAVKVRSLGSVVNVWDVFYENETAYIVMEYISGVTLKDYLIRRGRVLDVKECTELLLPVIHDLQGVHEKGIVHRDISPDNLMIREDGRVMLLDLGAAKDLSKGSTQSSQLVAKRGFSPPEQYTEKGEIGPWTDVYAMCATIYWCMTGKTIPEAMERMLGDAIEYPDSLPPAWAEVLRRGLEMNSNDRINDMCKLEGALKAAASNEGTDKPATNEGKDKPAEERKQERNTAKPIKSETDEFAESHNSKTERKAEKDINNKTNGKNTGAGLFPIPIGVVIAIAALVVIVIFVVLKPSPKPNPGGGDNPAQIVEEAENTEEEIKVPDEVTETDATDEKPDEQLPSEQIVLSGTLSKDKFQEWADRTAVEVEFLSTLDGAPSDAIDLSEEGNRSVLGWVEEYETNEREITAICIAGNGYIKAPKDCSFLFSDKKAEDNDSKRWLMLERINGAGYLDMSQVQDTHEMFSFCQSLVTLDVSGWDISNVTDVNCMFVCCRKLQELDVSDWNTSNVTDMHSMFWLCDSLQTLNVSNWDTSKVNNMFGVFLGCSSLTELNVSNWDTSNVTDMRNMFYDCSSLEVLDVSKWDLSSLTRSESAFDYTKWQDNPPF